MVRRKLTKKEKARINGAVAHFDEHRHLFDGFAKSVLSDLRDDTELSPFVHFIKYRLKSASRLKDKLVAKALDGEKPDIDNSNLFEEINDLAGIRILHLHTTQFGEMNKHIKRILHSKKIRIVEGPNIHCWDRDYENVFKRFGIAVKKPSNKPGARNSMYTSVHYILEANERTKITFELQVRTLADELWAEVSHRVAYEEKASDTHVQDQLQVLARLTSASSRLVDSIIDTFSDT
jgi:putative GTP pyrophosphokinase